MSPDSLNQYRQALSGNYTDGHPPILSLILRLFLTLGLGIGEIMFFQCFFWLFGLRSLSNTIQKSLANREPNVYLMESMSLITTLILLSPITPLISYLMTFWKDCWVAILFIWICSLSINIFLKRQNTNRLLLNFRLTALIFLISLSLLLRHNLIVVYPAYFLLLWLLLEHKNSKRRVLLSILPLIIYLFFNLVIYQVINVKKTFEGRKVLALEIAGICYQDIDQCKNFPFINKYIDFEDINKYSFTKWKKVFWRKKIFRHKLLKGENGEKLKHEYITGIVTYPHLFLKVKFKSFTEILGINRSYLWFFDFTMKNNLGLEQSDKYRYLRLKPRKYWFKISKSFVV